MEERDSKISEALAQLVAEGATGDLEHTARYRVVAQDHVRRTEIDHDYHGSYSQATLEQLVNLCTALGLSLDGTKAELAEYEP
jgi:hypothetical protein